MVSKLQRHHSLIVKMSKSCHHEVPLLLHLLCRLHLHWTDRYCNQLWKSYSKCHWHWSMFQRCLMRMTRLTQSQHHETLHGFVTLMTFECWLLLHELVVSLLLTPFNQFTNCLPALLDHQSAYLPQKNAGGWLFKSLPLRHQCTIVRVLRGIVLSYTSSIQQLTSLSKPRLLGMPKSASSLLLIMPWSGTRS